MRTIKSFNDGWCYAPQKLDIDAPNELFEPVTIPHTNRLFPYHHVDSQDFQFISTYRKTFDLPEALDGRQAFLDFEGAMVVSTVYLNGQEIGTHKGGYTPFSFDITEFLQPGQNTLTIHLDSTERSDVPPFGGRVDYLTFGGIYRDVHLRLVHPCHIQNIFAQPQDVLTAPKLHCDIQLSQPQADLTITGTLTDQQGAVIASMSQSADSANPRLIFSAPLAVERWTLDSPTLYTLTLTLQAGETLIDTASTRLGFRTAEFSKDGSFYLNGELLKLMGLNRHQTYPYIGAAAPVRLQRQDADILKFEIGCNIVRTSHYPQSPHFLDRCDEIGLLVFEEIPGWQHIGDEAWQALVLRDVRAMIERDRNHPSIILWGVRINESPDHDTLYRQTNALAHQLDATRQTGGVRNFLGSSFHEDVYTYNDFSDGVRNPTNQPHLITEFCGHMFPTKTWDGEERRIDHALLHARKQNLQMGRSDVAGAIGWCAFDYNTHHEFGSGDRICHHGVMDMFRLPKWAAYVYQSQISPSQRIVLEPATHWTMGDRSAGGNHPLTVFSNCEEIEVYSGETCIGRFQPDVDEYPHLKHPPFTVRWAGAENPWRLPFGDLRLVGYIGQQAVVERCIASDHIPHALQLQADACDLLADGIDMTRLTFRIVDRYGNVLPYVPSVVHFEVQGDAALIGDNPFPLIAGQAALYVKSGRTAGAVTITATTAQLAPVAVTITLRLPT